MPVRKRTNSGRWIIDLRIAGKRYRETLGEEHDRLGKREVEGLAHQRRQAIEAQGRRHRRQLGRGWNRYLARARPVPEVGATMTGHLDRAERSDRRSDPGRRITTEQLRRGRCPLAPDAGTRAPSTPGSRWPGRSGASRVRFGDWTCPRSPGAACGSPARPGAALSRASGPGRDRGQGAAHVALAMRLATRPPAAQSACSAVLAARRLGRELIHGRGKGRPAARPWSRRSTSELRAILLGAAGPEGHRPRAGRRLAGQADHRHR